MQLDSTCHKTIKEQQPRIPHLPGIEPLLVFVRVRLGFLLHLRGQVASQESFPPLLAGLREELVVQAGLPDPAGKRLR